MGSSNSSNELKSGSLNGNTGARQQAACPLHHFLWNEEHGDCRAGHHSFRNGFQGGLEDVFTGKTSVKTENGGGGGVGGVLVDAVARAAAN